MRAWTLAAVVQCGRMLTIAALLLSLCGHFVCIAECSLSGVKLTSRMHCEMSANKLRADTGRTLNDLLLS
jgi:hypothetical protein